MSARALACVSRLESILRRNVGMSIGGSHVGLIKSSASESRQGRYSRVRVQLCTWFGRCQHEIAIGPAAWDPQAHGRAFPPMAVFWPP